LLQKLEGAENHMQHLLICFFITSAPSEIKSTSDHTEITLFNIEAQSQVTKIAIIEQKP
jgi:hypothetical protein